MDHSAYLQMAASEERHWWYRGRRKILRAVIKRLRLPAGAKILEVGSGTGGNLAMLAAFGQVTAVELNDAARAISIEKTAGRYDIRAGAMPDGLPLGDDAFDLICMFDVLEHVQEDEATLAAISRHLARNGVVLITVPAFRRLWGPHDVALHHKRRYEKAELREKLLAAGYMINRLSFINMVLFPAALALRLRDRLLRPATASGVKPPPRLLNALLAGLFGAEFWMLRLVDLPFGLSLLATVTRD